MLNELVRIDSILGEGSSRRGKLPHPFPPQVGEGIISTATQRPTSSGSEAEGGEDAVVLELCESYKCGEGILPVGKQLVIPHLMRYRKSKQPSFLPL